MGSFSLGPSAVWCDVKLHTKINHPEGKGPGLHSLHLKAAHGKTYFCIRAFGLRFSFLDCWNRKNLPRVQTQDVPAQTGCKSKSGQGLPTKQPTYEAKEDPGINVWTFQGSQERGCVTQSPHPCPALRVTMEEPSVLLLYVEVSPPQFRSEAFCCSQKP